MERAREDLKGLSLSATYKPMPSGEERWRLRPLRLGLETFAMHLTKAPPVPQWQEAHWHGGLMEQYLVLKGKIGYVTRVSPLQKTPYFSHGVIAAINGLFSFRPGEVHNIFPGPEAEFVTIQQRQGVTIPNPDRNLEDWWPTDEAFNSSVQWMMAEVEKMF